MRWPEGLACRRPPAVIPVLVTPAVLIARSPKQLNAGTTLGEAGAHPLPGQEHRETLICAPRRVVSAMLFGSTEQDGRRDIGWLYDRVRVGVPTARCARSRRIGRRLLCASWEMSDG